MNTISIQGARDDDAYLAWAVQDNNRQRTRRQRAYIQRRLDHETLSAASRTALEAELAALSGRHR